VIVERPEDVEARNNALYGSWLCGTVLGTVGMALHHKLCHTLGGSFGLPHAETHAIMLPILRPITPRRRRMCCHRRLNYLVASWGRPVRLRQTPRCPLSLKELGLAETDLDRTADLAVQNPYWNPRPVEREAVRELLQRAWSGTRPE